MGRKSQKGKEKKMKRKEAMAKMSASQNLVDAANQLVDPMAALLPFKKYDRNSLNVTIECVRPANCEKHISDWAFNLTKLNMRSLYEGSDWGWNDRLKKEELSDEAAWYLLATDSNRRPVAFSHFRFDIDDEIEVVYCYEVQLEKDVRRKGLGKFMVQILELLSAKAQMKKVILTVFKDNDLANRFFRNTLSYEVDETSPSVWDPLADYSYEILSKNTVPKSKRGHGCGCDHTHEHHHDGEHGQNGRS